MEIEDNILTIICLWIAAVIISVAPCFLKRKTINDYTRKDYVNPEYYI